MTDFVKELKAHKAKVKTGISHVGTQEEMQKLRRATDEITQFCNGIKDTTKAGNVWLLFISIFFLESISSLWLPIYPYTHPPNKKYNQLKAYHTQIISHKY